ncbi:MAG: acetyl-CoA carboxylase biotin carboxylase subunit [Armatimonadetes bacterium]|nr:acetyl-CoA carboxylase biotin carboxylase subunit [Armatimonadota bacterium]MDW8122150.1 acetyl-CoA carboxylase biotin carboxylase subunit [Armatimonadota bacterium]
MFRKILVANRGEIAVRVIRACQELGIRTVAVYSEADRDAAHTHLADEAICIGPPPAKDSYLNVANIIAAAIVTGSEAIHPGYGFLSEDSRFAEICQHYRIKFIGPKPETIRAMGDKVQARQLAVKAGVPVIPGRDHIQSEREATAAAAELGYPVLIKAAAGGGGRGIRIVHSETELIRNLSLARSESEAAFGNGALYLEKYLEEPRHIEIQILADEHGNILALGERECSVQNVRHQKLIEEAPAPGLTPQARERIARSAMRLCAAVGYTSAGTCEFLVSRDGHFYFIEMNTRIQVEHPVTEMVTGIDLIKEQIRLAAGERLSIRQVEMRGHSLECRLTAEDPDRNFAPDSGTITRLRLPAGPGVRVDTHIYEGYWVPPFYDPLLAKIITHGRDRNEAIARMRRALREFVIEGVKTTLPLHQRLLEHTRFVKGDLSTAFLPRFLAEEYQG